MSMEVAVSLAEQHEVHSGLLKVLSSRVGATCMVQLRGELDLATAEVVEQALEKAFGEDAGHVIVDMTELEFIDSTGIALLVTAVGRDGDGTRLRFVQSRVPAVRRIFEVTGIADRLPFVAGTAGTANGNSGTD
jgi:stage II sporulation protein AA (anti-sigma F factor antagonist)